jgi:hypothetical protein
MHLLFYVAFWSIQRRLEFVVVSFQLLSSFCRLPRASRRTVWEPLPCNIQRRMVVRLVKNELEKNLKGSGRGLVSGRSTVTAWSSWRKQWSSVSWQRFERGTSRIQNRKQLCDDVRCPERHFVVLRPCFVEKTEHSNMAAKNLNEEKSNYRVPPKTVQDLPSLHCSLHHLRSAYRVHSTTIQRDTGRLGAVRPWSATDRHAEQREWGRTVEE